VPPDHWDDTAGKIRDEAKYAEWVNANAAIAAERRSFEATLPQAADGYKIATTPNFKAPEGLDFKINDKDPLWPQAQALAHKWHLPQQAFSEFIDLVGGDRVGSAQAIAAAKAEQVAQLGPSAQARADSVIQWVNAMMGPKSADMAKVFQQVPLASTIEAFEYLMQQVSSQGLTRFNQAHRATPPSDQKIQGYQGMTFEQRRAAQDNQRRGSGR
jgi:hypothetical protein